MIVGQVLTCLTILSKDHRLTKNGKTVTLRCVI